LYVLLLVAMPAEPPVTSLPVLVLLCAMQSVRQPYL